MNSICFMEVMEMRFEELIEKLNPKLLSISSRISRYSGFNDKDDILQEIYIYLWKSWKTGRVECNTDSYILQGCSFHIKNYLRKKANNSEVISLSGDTDEEAPGLLDILTDGSNIDNDTDYRITIDRVLANGLTDREKEVFKYTLDGYTLREIGELLGVSFVRVLKIRNNIKKKIEKEIAA